MHGCMQMEEVILKSNYIMRFFGNRKYRKFLRELLIYILKSCFIYTYLYMLYFHFSVLEIYINVTVNSNSVRNYCSYKKMK